MITENGGVADRKQQQKLGKRRCMVATAAVLLLLLTIFVIAFIVFKPKDPKTEIVSYTVNGTAPRLSFPVVRVELNVTLDLEILVHNPNYARFKHGPGKSLVFYRGNQVGEVDLPPGQIPDRGSKTLRCLLTLEADELASDMNHLISDVRAGELVIDTRTRIPGRVTFLRIFKKHAVAVSDCQVAIGIPDLKIRRQDCKNKTKL